MATRRTFLLGLTTAAASRAALELTGKQRVDRALRGQEQDRPPYTAWYHFQDEKESGAQHARSTLSFHERFRTDLVKVMSDYPYPKPAQGEWYQLRVNTEPFPAQLAALQAIRAGLGSDTYFLETIFNPWNVAEKLSSPAAVQQLMAERPQTLLDALDTIAKTLGYHAKKSVQRGAAGVFLAIANAQTGILTAEQYAKFSEPFDRQVLAAVSGAPLNTLHLHGDKVFLDHFAQGWPASVINYSVHGTAVPLKQFRQQYGGVLMAGWDERRFRTLSSDELRAEYAQARQETGPKLILAPGCSVPNETTDDELRRAMRLFRS